MYWGQGVSFNLILIIHYLIFQQFGLWLIGWCFPHPLKLTEFLLPTLPSNSPRPHFPRSLQFTRAPFPTLLLHSLGPISYNPQILTGSHFLHSLSAHRCPDSCAPLKLTSFYFPCYFSTNRCPVSTAPFEHIRVEFPVLPWNSPALCFPHSLETYFIFQGPLRSQRHCYPHYL